MTAMPRLSASEARAEMVLYASPAVFVAVEKCEHGVYKDPSKACHPDHADLTRSTTEESA